MEKRPKITDSWYFLNLKDRVLPDDMIWRPRVNAWIKIQDVFPNAVDRNTLAEDFFYVIRQKKAR